MQVFQGQQATKSQLLVEISIESHLVPVAYLLPKRQSALRNGIRFADTGHQLRPELYSGLLVRDVEQQPARQGGLPNRAVARSGLIQHRRPCRIDHHRTASNSSASHHPGLSAENYARSG